MMQWQFYWPSWWKLWPYFNTDIQQYNDFAYLDNVFCLGALQINWMSHSKALDRW